MFQALPNYTPQNKFLEGKNNSQYWDAHYGYSWHFSQTGFREYVPGDTNKRIWVTVDDVILPVYTWDVFQDTLFIRHKKEIDQKYLIYKLTEDTLIVRDFNKSWGWDTLFFYKSADQASLPH